MFVSQFNDMIFIENEYACEKKLQEVHTTIGGMFKSAQLSNLNEVKADLAYKAKQIGANAVINFEYGQKSVGILASIFSRDDVNWYGRGMAVVISEQNYNELLQK